MPSASSPPPAPAEDQPPRFARNQTELAKVLGCSRRMISVYSKKAGRPPKKPDGRLDVAAWQEFLGDAVRGSKEYTEIDSDDSSQTEVRTEHIKLQNEKIAFQIAVLKKEYIAFTVAEQMAGEVYAGCRSILMQLPKLAPTVAGLSVADTETRLREIVHEFMTQLSLLDERLDQLKPAG